MESGFYNDGKMLFVVFGGKIGVGSGTLTINDSDKKYAFVSFSESIGSYSIGEDILDKESIPEDKIALFFDNVASVDVVINALERIKGKLVEKE